MKVLRAAIVTALLVGPAYGQDSVQRYGEPDKAKTPAELRADKAAEKAYKDSLGNIPDGGSTDPWGGARAVGAPKETAKPAAKTAAKSVPAKPAKIGGTAN